MYAMKSPINKFSLRWSMVLHGFMLLVVIGFAIRHRFVKKKLPAPVEFTVVLPEEMPEPVEETPPAAEPEIEPVREPDPVMPDSLPPIKEAVVAKKEPPKPKPKPKPPKPKPEPKPKKPDPPKKTPFKRGKRVTQKPKTDFTKLKRATVRTPSQKPMSRDDIQRALQAGARPGARNEIPDGEISRCISLVRRAMYDNWEEPGSAEAGPRPAQLTIRLDSAGRVVSYSIHKSSGSKYFDQSVLRAAANVRQIPGLSSGFLKQYETLTIEFILE